MKLQYYVYGCEDCGKKFKSPEIISNYGEFLMRSEKGNIAYLSALDDKVFNEFADKLHAHPLLCTLERIEQSKILHRIFGLACDLSSDGTRYEITNKPVCAYCGKKHILTWGPPNPPEYIDLDIKCITHDKWNNLSDTDKLFFIDKEVRNYFNSKNNELN